MLSSRMLVLLASLFFGYHSVYSRPAGTGREADQQNVNEERMQFLNHFGYVHGWDTDPNITESVSEFQEFAGIPITGRFDPLTTEYMRKPRCGMPDDKWMRKRRYSLQGSYWRDTNITWALENQNNDGISNSDVRRVLSKAFAKWEAATNIYFRELVDEPSKSPIIRIRFEQGFHGDPFLFDGNGGIILHAFYPLNNRGLAGDIHFDDAERFSVDSDAESGETKLMWLAVHGIGHTIGLGHSSTINALMHPYYQNFSDDDFNLHNDDISGAQKLYGEKDTTSSLPTLPPATSPSV